MSELSKLQGKSKVFNIGGVVEMEIHPFGVDELHYFAVDEKTPLKERAIEESKMVDEVLKRTFPDSTEIERNGLGLKYVNEIKKAILEVNGLKGDNKIDLVKQRQAFAAKAEATRNKE